MRALILTAGNGKRLGLKHKPKCMAIVAGKPILEHLVNHLNKAGITEIMVNIHKGYEPIFKYFGSRLLYFYEPTLMGEAATEKMLENWLGDEYIVMNGDTLTNINPTAIAWELPFRRVMFSKNGRYAGTTRVNIRHKGISNIDFSNWYYFDCGTPKKLAKARRFYSK
jgi:GTP:adenosylcobinamide-phosphate guanylyltransferase